MTADFLIKDGADSKYLKAGEFLRAYHLLYLSTGLLTINDRNEIRSKSLYLEFEEST